MSANKSYSNSVKVSPLVSEAKVVPDDSIPFESHASLDKSSANYIIKTGIAGGLAGSCAKTLIAPLDRIKILFQTSNPAYRQYAKSHFGLFKAARQIYLTDGALGFYQGHSATLLRIFPYAAIKFVAYEQVRRLLIPDDRYETSIRRLLSGSIAGLCSVFITYPLDLIRVRLAYDTSSSSKKSGRLINTISHIYREEPIVSQKFFLVSLIKKNLPQKISCLTNFYRGFMPTIFGMVPYAGVSFWTHDFLHDVLRHRVLSEYTVDQTAKLSSAQKHSISTHEHRLPLNTWAQLLAGGLAGMFSQTAAYPFEVIRRRMQVGGVKNNGEFISISTITKLIWKERGFRGFYVGLSIGYIKVIPMVACSFYVYERCKFHLGV